LGEATSAILRAMRLTISVEKSYGGYPARTSGFIGDDANDQNLLIRR
jgi:hypothetical protein